MSEKKVTMGNSKEILADGKPKDWHEVIEPPRKLADKVPKTGGVSQAEMLRRADAAVAEVAKEFERYLEGELDRLAAVQVDYKKTRSTEALEGLYSIVHNLRGQGATLGFPLVTQIGNSFCRYLVERDPTKPVNVGIVDQHIEALRVVYRDRIDGNGDTVSREVAAALDNVVNRMLA